MNCLFRTFNSSESRRVAPPLSALLHGFLLIWLVHSPQPIFVATARVARGNGGTRVTRLYWPGRRSDSGPGAPELAAPVSLQHRDALARLAWTQPPKRGQGRNLPPSPVVQDETAKNSTDPRLAGSAYSALSQGPASGEDVKPALPIQGSDPQLFPWELREEGDVIVEITIDEAGNIVDKRVLHGMNPSIDQKVLLALESWHFHPATRDGIPIPSKQDVHYHFKPS